MSEPADVQTASQTSDTELPADLNPHVVEELLVEEISIDGMCGVY